MMGEFILRLSIWFLLTANFTLANIVIGVGIALFLPRCHTEPDRLRDVFRTLSKVFVAVPIAYIEAVQMIFRPHSQEEIVEKRVSSRRSPGLIFLDIFLITFTPKTIVIRYYDAGWYAVHLVSPRQRLSQQRLSQQRSEGISDGRSPRKSGGQP
jgi:multicomponent Na+:H+ antiporter subunit E